MKCAGSFEDQKLETRNNWEYVLLASWIIVIGTAVFLMADGQILGEDTTGIATVLLIVGLGLITNWNKYRNKNKKDT